MNQPVYNPTNPEYWRSVAAELGIEYSRWLGDEGKYASAVVQTTKLNTMVAERLADAYTEGFSANPALFVQEPRDE